MSKHILLTTVIIFMFFGAGCDNSNRVAQLEEQNRNLLVQIEENQSSLTKIDKARSEDDLFQRATEEINRKIKLKPLEFSCDNQHPQAGCAITEVSRKWAGLDPSNSTCIWSTNCGNGAIPHRYVTENGLHTLDANQVCNGVDSIICQNESGEIFYGDGATKIVPSGN